MSAWLLEAIQQEATPDDFGISEDDDEALNNVNVVGFFFRTNGQLFRAWLSITTIWGFSAIHFPNAAKSMTKSLDFVVDR
ncbi:MAG: hypothetical protein Q9203_002863 [Teloschistes exilis]